MIRAEYDMAIQAVRAMAALGMGIDFAAAIAAAERADAIGPILDPTLYHAAMDTHHLIKQGLRAAQTFMREVREIEAAFQEQRKAKGGA